MIHLIILQYHLLKLFFSFLDIIIILIYYVDITAVLQKVPDTEELLGLLADVEHKWDKIGTALKVSGNNLIAAFRDNNDDRARLSSVLTSWKESKSTPTTWETIIGIMENLKHDSTANKIRQFLAKHDAFSKYTHMNDFVKDVPLPSGKVYIYNIHNPLSIPLSKHEDERPGDLEADGPSIAPPNTQLGMYTFNRHDSNMKT